MKLYLLILVSFSTLSCSDAGSTTISTEKGKIQGAWLGLTESVNSNKKDVSFLYVFNGDTLSFTDETGKEVKYSYRLDTTGNLKFVVIQPDESLNISAPVSIAYELDGDSLKIVIAPPGLRPTEISDKNNQELIICKRKSS